MIAKAYFL